MPNGNAYVPNDDTYGRIHQLIAHKFRQYAGQEFSTADIVARMHEQDPHLNNQNVFPNDHADNDHHGGCRCRGTPDRIFVNLGHARYRVYDPGQAEEPVAVQADIDEAVSAGFSLERDLQSALRRNIQELEQGLTIIDGGQERRVESGRIDITASDTNNKTVVIELKAGAADRNAIGQIAAYMGDLGAEVTNVRGILVAGDFRANAIAAAMVISNLKLVKYGVQFTFKILRG